MVGRFVTISLAQSPVVRGRPAAGRCRLHHAECCVRTHVVVDALATASQEHLVRGIVPFTPLQCGCRVLDLFVSLIAAFSFGRTARPPSPRILCPVFFPVQTTQTVNTVVYNYLLCNYMRI